MERAARDLESGLYGKYYFNFISPISRQKLEDLAAKALQSSTVTQVIIQKFEFQYLHSPIKMRKPPTNVLIFVIF